METVSERARQVIKGFKLAISPHTNYQERRKCLREAQMPSFYKAVEIAGVLSLKEVIETALKTEVQLVPYGERTGKPEDINPRKGALMVCTGPVYKNRINENQEVYEHAIGAGFLLIEDEEVRRIGEVSAKALGINIIHDLNNTENAVILVGNSREECLRITAVQNHLNGTKALIQEEFGSAIKSRWEEAGKNRRIIFLEHEGRDLVA